VGGLPQLQVSRKPAAIMSIIRAAQKHPKKGKEGYDRIGLDRIGLDWIESDKNSDYSIWDTSRRDMGLRIED